MKGRISLADFIIEVKQDLISAQDRSGNGYLGLSEVTLEVSFAVDTSAKAGANLYVVDFSTTAKAQQTHKVVLKFHPIPQEEPLDIIQSAQLNRPGNTEVATSKSTPTKRRASGSGGGPAFKKAVGREAI